MGRQVSIFFCCVSPFSRIVVSGEMWVGRSVDSYF